MSLGEEVVVAIQVGVVSAEDWNVVEDVNVKVWIRFEKKNGNSEDWNSRRDKEEWWTCLSLAADWLQFEQGYVQISSELKQGILEVNSQKIEMNSKIYFDARFDTKSGVATNDFLENFNLKVEMYEDRSVNKGINTDIIIQTNEEFISYSNFILLIISMMIKLSYYSRAFRKISNLYEESQMWYWTSQLIIYGFLLILTLLEVRVINEMVPLENNSVFTFF